MLGRKFAPRFFVFGVGAERAMDHRVCASSFGGGAAQRGALRGLHVRNGQDRSLPWAAVFSSVGNGLDHSAFFFAEFAVVGCGNPSVSSFLADSSP